MEGRMVGDASARCPAPFVGRREEAGRLLEAISPVFTGRSSRAVLILAPTGGGKTAFVEHVIPAIESRGAVVAEGKFDQVVRDVPYAAIGRRSRGHGDLGDRESVSYSLKWGMQQC
jgi:hypothetical protein